MSNEKRKTIGRQLNTQASIAEMTDTGRSQIATLRTGRHERSRLAGLL
ncbi:hypothetical protein ACLBSJ_33290, partial [Klebsiella pneumoniae]